MSCDNCFHNYELFPTEFTWKDDEPLRVNLCQHCLASARNVNQVSGYSVSDAIHDLMIQIDEADTEVEDN